MRTQARLDAASAAVEAWLDSLDIDALAAGGPVFPSEEDEAEDGPGDQPPRP